MKLMIFCNTKLLAYKLFPNPGESELLAIYYSVSTDDQKIGKMRDKYLFQNTTKGKASNTHAMPIFRSVSKCF